MPCVQSLGHAWLAAPRPGPGEDVVIHTENLRKYLARRRWLRCGQAIRAVTRLSSKLGTVTILYIFPTFRSVPRSGGEDTSRREWEPGGGGAGGGPGLPQQPAGEEAAGGVRWTPEDGVEVKESSVLLVNCVLALT